jgi:octopine/nopaline transport system permease protein
MHIDFDFLLDTLRQLFAAVPTTLGLFFSSLVLGGLLSLVIVTMRVSPHWLPNRFARAYILVFRGSPLLIQMFLVYYGLGQFGVIRESFLWPVLREPYMCAVLSLALCTAGYTAEIIRGGLMAVPVGQIEAGYAIGLSGFALLRRVIGPIALRQSPCVFDRGRAAREVDRARESRHRVGSDRRRAADHPADLSDY